MPGLYTDRLEMWTKTSGAHLEVSGGYDFVKHWRYPLPGVFKVAMSLVNFLLAPSSILSYQTNITNATTTSALIKINPIGS